MERIHPDKAHKYFDSPMRIVIAVFLALLSVLAFASDSTTITNGQTLDINAHGVCKRVTNNSGQSQYVPTVSSGEWSSFYNSTHTGVTIIDCPAACGGYSYGGYCWYFDSSSNVCDTTCSSHGGCNDFATSSYAVTNCAALALAITGYSYSAAGFTPGCSINIAYGPYAYSNSTGPQPTGGCSTARVGNFRGICACNN